MIEYTITNDNLHISDSAYVSKRSFWKELADIYVMHSNLNIFKRSINSLLNEWATHNALYACHILRSHTKDVDLNYPQRWYVRFGYWLMGNIVWPFIK